MIKHMENLNNAYYFLKKSNVNSLDEAISYINSLLNYVELYSQKYVNYNGLLYKNELLSFKSESCIDIVDVQSRILDGFKYDINLLLEFMNESNYNELVEPAHFIFEKLKVNMWATEGKKINLVLQQNIPTMDISNMNKYPDEDSLFVETFFVNKLSEITNTDILSLKR